MICHGKQYVSSLQKELIMNDFSDRCSSANIKAVNGFMIATLNELFDFGKKAWFQNAFPARQLLFLDFNSISNCKTNRRACRIHAISSISRIWYREPEQPSTAPTCSCRFWTLSSVSRKVKPRREPAMNFLRIR